MKILLAALNAKFIHSNPAVYSLAAYCREAAGGGGRSTDAKGILFPDVLSADVQPADILPTDMPDMEIAEYTINQPTGQILADIYGREPDVLMFSCYIWNRREIESLVSDAGKIMPGADIWLGGPEVSFAAEKALETLPEARGVMRGEGEETFRRLAAVYAVRDEEGRRPDRSDLEAIAGITFRDGEDIVSCSGREACVDLDSILFLMKI